MTGPVIHARAGRTPLPLCSELTIRSPYAAPIESYLSRARVRLTHAHFPTCFITALVIPSLAADE